ncbi:MAG: M3 family metallopeptidase [Alphaproteobacteria bacterium]|nr:M3 family metallopeptidase [Alphaproteobacteria bacterium]
MANRSSAATNPLLSKTYLPNKALPFDRVTPRDIKAAIIAGMEEGSAEIAAIADNKDAPTFANTIEAIEFSGETLSRAQSTFGALLGAQKTPELSKIEKQLQPLMSAYGAQIIMNDKLFARVKAVYEARDTLALDDDQRVLLDKTYRSFAASGAALPKAKKQRMQDINLRLSQLSTQFRDNVTASTKAWSKLITDEADLDGVPARVKEQLKHAAKEAGHPEGTFLIRLAPSPGAIMSYGTNRSLREEIYKASASVANSGQYDNRPVIMEIVKLRHEKANIMGYKTYAGMILEDRMAQTPQVVEDFLAKNLQTYKAAADLESKAVKDLAAADGLTEFKPWDSAMYSRKLQERDYKLDTELLRPYFALDKVVDGLFAHAEKLFNIGFSPADSKYPVYDPSMQVFEVHDKADGSLVGVFYTDYYARPGLKRDGAWMNAFQSAGQNAAGKMDVPHVINVCNYDPPVPGKQTLLSLRDVTTMFHEFGHGLHGLLGKGRYPSLTGTSVKWDFVELPSQLQENWVLQKEVLDSFAVHNETGKKMPAALIAKVRAVNNFGAASAGRRQTFLGMLDMAWHNNNPSKINNVEEHEEKISKLTGIFNPAAVGTQSTGFGHIFAGGYAAGYYGYKWAEVLDADIFATKFEGNLYDRKNADELRAKIYAAGGSRPPMELFVDYMGRQPDPEALFKREGLLPANDTSKATPKKAPRGPAPGV